MITLDGTTPVGDTRNMWHLKTETVETAKKKSPKFNCQVPLEGTFSCRCYFQKRESMIETKMLAHIKFVL